MCSALTLSVPANPLLSPAVSSLALVVVPSSEASGDPDSAETSERSSPWEFIRLLLNRLPWLPAELRFEVKRSSRRRSADEIFEEEKWLSHLHTTWAPAFACGFFAYFALAVMSFVATAVYAVAFAAGLFGAAGSAVSTPLLATGEPSQYRIAHWRKCAPVCTF